MEKYFFFSNQTRLENVKLDKFKFLGRFTFLLKMTITNIMRG